MTKKKITDFITCNLKYKKKTIQPYELDDKLVALFFGASYCPPCVNFTPILENFQNEHGIELLIVCKDKTEKEYNEFVKKFKNAKSIPFTDLKSGLLTELTTKFSVTTIPKLFILDGNCNILERDAREKIENSNKEEQLFLSKKWNYFNSFRNVF